MVLCPFLKNCVYQLSHFISFGQLSIILPPNLWQNYKTSLKMVKTSVRSLVSFFFPPCRCPPGPLRWLFQSWQELSRPMALLCPGNFILSIWFTSPHYWIFCFFWHFSLCYPFDLVRVHPLVASQEKIHRRQLKNICIHLHTWKCLFSYCS